jgi:dTDP-4-amino-4,6-dideoxygalactose transaminase
LTVYADPPGRVLPFPLNEPSCRLYELARHGLWHGVRALGLGAGDEVLTPAYCYGAEIEVFRRVGLTCRYYVGSQRLEPDEGELDTLVGSRTRALYLIHYLGFPQDAPRWRRWCDARGLMLIEDAAQAWLASVQGQPVGSFGHLAIFSLRKTLGLPDGGAALATSSLAKPASRRRMGARGLVLGHGTWLMARSSHVARLGLHLKRRLDRPYVPEEDFALGNPWRPPSRASAFLLPRVANPNVAVRRRANYRILLEMLGELVPPPFAGLPDGACPWLFPIQADDKAGVLGRLARSGIEATEFWSVPHPSVPAEQFPAAAARRGSTIALPVHHELSRPDLERVAGAVR